MLQRGRKAVNSANIVALPGQKAKAPADLTPAQAKVWKALVATKPADWFPADCQPLLAGYCRLVVTIDELSERIDNLPPGAPTIDYGRLLKMRTNEVLTMVRLATALRLTPQSRMGADTAARASTAAGDAGKPWESDE